jgi:hypothetical protein
MITFWLFVSLSAITTILIIIAGIRTNTVRRETEFLTAHYAELMKMCQTYDRSISECIAILKSLTDSTEELKKTLQNKPLKNKDENLSKNN